MTRKRLLSLVPLIWFTFSFQCCSSLNTFSSDDGSATKTGNPQLAGTIKDTKGPAAGVIVTLYPEDFNPVTDAVPDSLRDITDSEGEYLFKAAKSGIYNIQALHPESRTGALIQGVEVPDAVDTVVSVPDASLEPQGTVLIHIKEQAVEENGHVYIPGTGINVQISGIDMSNGFVTVEELPPSVYPAINYTAPDGSAEPLPIEEEIDVQAGDTLEIGRLTVPDFTVVDILGQEHHLYEYTSAGKYVLILWSSSTCFNCEFYHPYLNEFYDTYGCNSGGLIILLISGKSSDTDYKMADLAVAQDLEFPVVSGKDGGGYNASQQYDDHLSSHRFQLINPQNDSQLSGGTSEFNLELRPMLPTVLSEAGISEKSCPDTGPRLLVQYGSGSGSYQPGEKIPIEAVERSHRFFLHWSGDVEFLDDSLSATATVTIPDKDVTVYGVYGLETDGYIMPSGPGHTVTVEDTLLFYDDGGSNFHYTRNFEGEVTFVPGVQGRTVRIEFLEFSVEDSTVVYVGRTDTVVKSSWDKMYIYDGNDTAAQSLGIFCGDRNPGIFTSTTDDGSITIKWVSNHEQIKTGWKARITLFPTETTSLAKPARSPVTSPAPLLLNIETGGLLFF